MYAVEGSEGLASWTGAFSIGINSFTLPYLEVALLPNLNTKPFGFQ